MDKKETAKEPEAPIEDLVKDSDVKISSADLKTTKIFENFGDEDEEMNDLLSEYGF